MKLAVHVLAVLIAASAVALAVWLYSSYEAESYKVRPRATVGYGGERPWRSGDPLITERRKADWQDPLAAFVLVAGLGMARLLAVRSVTSGERSGQ